jgi:hypothetical protein
MKRYPVIALRRYNNPVMKGWISYQNKAFEFS